MRAGGDDRGKSRETERKVRRVRAPAGNLEGVRGKETGTQKLGRCARLVPQGERPEEKK